MKMNKTSSLLNAWKEMDLPLFKSILGQMLMKDASSIRTILNQRYKKAYRSENYEYFKAMIEWAKPRSKEEKAIWIKFEKDLLMNSEQHIIKQNADYLKIHDLFLNESYCTFLPSQFAKYWPEGWKIFTDNNLHKMSPETKQMYLLETFININPELNEYVKATLTQKEICEVVDVEHKTRGFWSSNTPMVSEHSDEQIVYFLKWSASINFPLTPKFVFQYCDGLKPKTFSYLVDTWGKNFIEEFVFPSLENKIRKISSEKTKSSRRYSLQILKTKLLKDKIEIDLPEKKNKIKGLKL